MPFDDGFIDLIIEHESEFKLNNPLLFGEGFHLFEACQALYKEYESTDFGTMDYSIKLSDDEIAQVCLAALEAADARANRIVAKMGIGFSELYPEEAN